MGQACVNPGTVVLESKSCLMTLYKITIKQWQDAIDSFFRNYANIVRVSGAHIAEMLEDLALKRDAIHEVLTLLQLPTQMDEEDEGGGEAGHSPVPGSKSEHESDQEAVRNGSEKEQDEEKEQEQEHDMDTNEFIFSVMMLSHGTLSEKVALFVKRYDAGNMRWIKSTGFLLIIMAVVRGLFHLTTLTPPSYFRLQEFAFQKERWMTSDIVEALEKDEGAKQYLEALADLHSNEEARTTAKRLAGTLKRETDPNTTKLRSSEAEKFARTGNDVDDEETTLVFPEMYPFLLKDIAPALPVDALLQAYDDAEKECIKNLRLTFAIKGMQPNQKARYGFYRPLSLDDVSILVLPALPFIALDKRKAGVLPYQYFGFLTEICNDLNPNCVLPASWPHGKPIKLADWTTQVGYMQLVHNRVSYYDQLRATFDKYDNDGSGYLDQTELSKPISDLMSDIIMPTLEQMDMITLISQKMAQDTLEIIDLDDSGQIDWSEFRKAIGIVHSKMREVSKAIASSSTMDVVYAKLLNTKNNH